jgi:hypothetical protein
VERLSWRIATLATRPMMTTVRLLALAVLLTVVATACAMSEETRCKKGGGVWRGTLCETPAG